MLIKSFIEADYSQISAIYQEGIDTGIATFENHVPTWDTWNEGHLLACRLAIFEADTMFAWAALSPVSGRCVYAGVAEVSLYVSANSRGKGVGKILLENLIKTSEKEGIWTLQSGIFAENSASIKLHESCHFRMVGYREKIGQKNGVWKDTVLMERRSKKIGL